MRKHQFKKGQVVVLYDPTAAGSQFVDATVYKLKGTKIVFQLRIPFHECLQVKRRFMEVELSDLEQLPDPVLQ